MRVLSSGVRGMYCWVPGAVRELRWGGCLPPRAAGSPVGHGGAGAVPSAERVPPVGRVLLLPVLGREVRAPRPPHRRPVHMLRRALPAPRSCSSAPGQLPGVAPRLWRARRAGGAAALGAGGGARGPRGRREGGQVARAGAAPPGGAWRRDKGAAQVLSPPPPCPQETRPSEQRPPGESGPSLWASVTEPGCPAADSWRPGTCHHHGPGALGRAT